MVIRMEKIDDETGKTFKTVNRDVASLKGLSRG